MEDRKKINEADLEGVSGGTLQQALEYMEELRKQYGLATREEVREVWTPEEEYKFQMILRQGVKPIPEPKFPIEN